MLLIFKDFYLVSFREGKRGRKRGKETSMCGCLSCAPHLGSGPQPRHVSWLGIERLTLWFIGQCSIHWAMPAGLYAINVIYSYEHSIHCAHPGNFSDFIDAVGVNWVWQDCMINKHVPGPQVQEVLWGFGQKLVLMYWRT